MRDNMTVQQRIDSEIEYYNTNVKNFVDTVEVFLGRTPEDVLTEVREFLDLISDARLRVGDPLAVRLRSIELSHLHLKQAILLCYKYMCEYQRNMIAAFKREYLFYDISAADDGKFNSTLHDMLKVANKAFELAQREEQKLRGVKFSEEEFAEVYTAYHVTYNKYTKTMEYIEKHRKGVVNIATKHKILSALSFLGWLISIVLSIVLSLFQQGNV